MSNLDFDENDKNNPKRKKCGHLKDYKCTCNLPQNSHTFDLIDEMRINRLHFKGIES